MCQNIRREIRLSCGMTSDLNDSILKARNTASFKIYDKYCLTDCFDFTDIPKSCVIGLPIILSN